MICPDCQLHLVGHASCELAAERAADWKAIWVVFDDYLDEVTRGIETWQPAGLANVDWVSARPTRPPTPLERALDILSPHLRDLPLYREETRS